MRSHIGLRPWLSRTIAAALFLAVLVPIVADVSDVYAADPPACQGATIPALVNPSFEIPGAPAGTHSTLPDSQVPGWLRTSEDRFIELWGNGFHGVHVDPGTGGSFAELNANKVAGTYQDLRTAPGLEMSWSLLHRGRNGVETMRVNIGAPGGTLVPQVPNGQTSPDISTGTSGWVRYSGTYTVPSGQTTTRFEFRAIGGGSSGNFVDDIQFTLSATACSDTATINAGSYVDVSPLTNDIGAGLALISLGSSPDGTAVISGDRIRFTPNPGFSGTTSVPYTMRDGSGVTSSSTVAVTVVPSAVPDTVSMLEGGTQAISVLANDQGSSLVVNAVTTAPGHGAVSIDSGGTGITYTPTVSFSGTDTFRYTVRDSHGQVSAPALVTVHVTPVADVSISVTPSALTPDPGDSLSFVYEVGNGGPADPVTGVVLSAVLPAGFTQTGVSGGGCSALPCTLGPIADGSSVSVTVAGTVDSDAPSSMHALGTVATPTGTVDPDASNNSDASALVAVSQDVDVSLTKSDSADPVPVGTQVTYTLTATNDGPHDATGVAILDHLPTDVSFVSGTGCSENAPGVVGCSIGALSVGATASRTIVVDTTTAPATADNHAHVFADQSDPDPSNNGAAESTVVTPLADLSESATATAATFAAGTDAAIVFSTTNLGPSGAAASAVEVPVPSGWVFKAGSAGCSEAGGTVSCALGDLVSSATVAKTLVFSIPPGSPAGDVDVTASASSTIVDPDPSNNTATATLTVESVADVSIAKTSPTYQPIENGTNVTFDLTVHNAGPSTATGVTITDPATTDLAFTSVDTGCTIDSGTGDVTCAVADLLPGASETVTLVAATGSVTGSTIVTNAATVSSAVSDPDGSNNTSSLDLDIYDTPPQLTILKQGPQSLVAGTTVAYSISLENISRTLTVEAVIVEDLLPPELTLVPGSLTTSMPLGVCDETTVSCDVGDVGPGVTFTVALEATAATDAFGELIPNEALATTHPTTGPPVTVSGTTVAIGTRVSDVEVTKTGPATAVGGTTISYDIEVSNHGPSDAVDVVVAELADPALIVTALTPTSGSCDLGALTCTVDVANGATVQIAVDGTIDPSFEGPLVNKATVTDPTDPDTSDNEATATTTVWRVADLELTKTANATDVLTGDQFVWTIEVTNNGPSMALPGEAIVTEILPIGVTYVADNGNCTFVDPGLTCDLPGLAPGASIDIDVLVVVDPGPAGPLTNNAVVGTLPPLVDPDPDNNSDQSTVTNLPVADLRVVIDTSTPSLLAGEMATFTLTVSNLESSDAARDVKVVIPIPVGITSVTAGGPCVEIGSDLVCSFGDIPPLATAPPVTIDMVTDPQFVTGNNVAPLVVIALGTTTSGELVLSNDQDSAVAVVGTESSITITKATADDHVTPGLSTTYTFVVSNAGPSAAHDVAVVDTFVDGVTPTAPAGCAVNGQDLECDIGTIPPGGSVTFDVVVAIAPDFTGAVVNSVDVSASNAPVQGHATVAFGTVPEADFAITKTHIGSDVVGGSQTTYRLTATNAGPSTAVDVTLTDALPGEVSWVSGDAACSESSGIVVCSAGSLDPGDSATFEMVVLVNPGTVGPFHNEASVQSETHDTDPSNNTDGDSATAHGIADLAIAKTVDTLDIHPGSRVDYTVVVTNRGPSTAFHVQVEDTFPAGLTPFEATVVPGSGAISDSCAITGQAVVCDLETVAPGTAEIKLSATVGDTTGTIINIALVKATTTDPDTTNNVASATIESGTLPSTGAQIAMLAWVGTILLMAGLAALRFTRRRAVQ